MIHREMNKLTSLHNQILLQGDLLNKIKFKDDSYIRGEIQVYFIDQYYIYIGKLFDYYEKYHPMEVGYHQRGGLYITTTLYEEIEREYKEYKINSFKIDIRDVHYIIKEYNFLGKKVITKIKLLEIKDESN